ncbi:unnamed protein product, partial [Trichobilharzia regenti]
LCVCVCTQFSASRCKIIRIQEACFDNHQFLQSLNHKYHHYYNPCVLVLAASSSSSAHLTKPKVYRFMCHTSHHHHLNNFKGSNDNSSKSTPTHLGHQVTFNLESSQLSPSETQAATSNATYHIPSWSWTTRTTRRLTQAIKQKLGTRTPKKSQSTKRETAEYNSSAQNHSNRPLLHWLPQLLTLFPNNDNKTTNDDYSLFVVNHTP